MFWIKNTCKPKLYFITLGFKGVYFTKTGANCFRGMKVYDTDDQIKRLYFMIFTFLLQSH